MSNLLISVIVPVYNIAPYIERCIESILAQTYKNIEIIIVDDGSTDSTPEIVDLYEKKYANIKVIHKKNEGVSCARLTGIFQSSGQYIGFVDGDDWIEPYMYELLINNAVQYKADISHCGYQMDFPNGHSDYYHGTGKKMYQNHEQGIEDLLSGRMIEPGLVNKLFKRDIIIDFELSPIWDSTIKINEDLLMNYILFLKAKRSFFEDKCMYHYTLRKNSAATSKRSLNKITDPIKVMKIIFEDTQSNNKLALIAYEKYLRTLVMAVQQNDFKDTADKALESLKVLRSNHLYSKLTTKLKIMFFSATYFTPLYLLVRNIYDIVTRKNQKYTIN